MAGGGRGSPLAVSLKKIGSWLAMLSIRLYQGFFIFVISPDYDTVITKSFFVLMLDSEGYYLTINVVGRSYPQRIVNDMSCNDLVMAYDEKFDITKALDGDR